MNTPKLTAEEVSAFREAASALLAARERIELAKQRPTGKYGMGVEHAAKRALQVVGGICTKGRGITALRCRGQLFFPARQDNGSVILYVVPEDEIAEVPG